MSGQAPTAEVHMDYLYILLGQLDNDAERFLELRRGVEGDLERYRHPSPPDGADEVFKRVSRRIEEGEQINNLRAYCRTTAWFVTKEEWRKPREVELDDNIVLPPPNDGWDEKRQLQFACKKQCFKERPLETRWLMIEYFDPTRLGANSSQHRKELAELLRVSQQQLINRVRTIRDVLSNCVKNCMKKQPSHSQ